LIFRYFLKLVARRNNDLPLLLPLIHQNLLKMENSNKQNPIRENKPSGNNDDQKITKKHEDDAFKTPDRENRLGWEQPMDEQQHDETSTADPKDEPQ